MTTISSIRSLTKWARLPVTATTTAAVAIIIIVVVGIGIGAEVPFRRPRRVGRRRVTYGTCDV